MAENINLSDVVSRQALFQSLKKETFRWNPEHFAIYDEFDDYVQKLIQHGKQLAELITEPAIPIERVASVYQVMKAVEEFASEFRQKKAEFDTVFENLVKISQIYSEIILEFPR